MAYQEVLYFAIRRVVGHLVKVVANETADDMDFVRAISILQERANGSIRYIALVTLTNLRNAWAHHQHYGDLARLRTAIAVLKEWWSSYGDIARDESISLLVDSIGIIIAQQITMIDAGLVEAPSSGGGPDTSCTESDSLIEEDKYIATGPLSKFKTENNPWKQQIRGKYIELLSGHRAGTIVKLKSFNGTSTKVEIDGVKVCIRNITLIGILKEQPK